MYILGILRIAVRNLKEIRGNNHRNPGTNYMICDFWIFEYITRRLMESVKY